MRGGGGHRVDGAGTGLEVPGLDCGRGEGGHTPGGETRRGRLRGGKGRLLQGRCGCCQEVVKQGCQQALRPEEPWEGFKEGRGCDAGEKGGWRRPLP